jgi:hypothetical protein
MAIQIKGYKLLGKKERKKENEINGKGKENKCKERAKIRY